MKLLVFCHEYPPLGGGAGNALSYLCKEWAKLGHQVVVVTSAYQNLRRLEVEDGVKIIRLAVGRKTVYRATLFQMIRYIIQSSYRAGSLFREERPNLCVAFMTLPAGIAPYLINRCYHVPFITHIRGGDVPGFGANFLKKLHWLASPLIYKIWKHSAYVIANNHGLVKLAQKTSHVNKMSAIPNGVDSTFYIPLVEKKPSDHLRLLFVGRFVDSQKNISMILKVLSKIQNVYLSLVGEGPDKDFLMRQALQLNIQSKVDFKNWLDKEELLKMYQNADLYVSASLWEGMTNATLEAMSCGLPLILSHVFGHENLVQQGFNGYLFKSTNEDELKQMILELRDNFSLRFLMGQRSRKKAIEEYNWGKIALQHQQYFLTH